MIDKLPLAEKTNIKNWPFEDLVLKDVSEPNLEGTDIEPMENQIILVDGKIVHNTAPPSIKVEDDEVSEILPVSNQLIASNGVKRNSRLVIVVPRNTHVTETVSVVAVAKERSLIHKTEVVLEDGASLDFVENYIGIGDFNANIVSTFELGANANLTLNTVSNMHAGTFVYHHKHGQVESDAVLDATNFMINDTNLVFEDFIYLLGRGAEAIAKTVAIASGQQKQNITVRTMNVADHTRGNITNYGIVKDNAHLAFNGIGKIKKAAKASDNQQETRLLNLSKTAEAIANPFLLIDEGDITAGHAASIGQLDEEQIYYLMSRGLSRAEASKMIVAGFLQPFIDAIEDDKTREVLLAKIEGKLDESKLEVTSVKDKLDLTSVKRAQDAFSNALAFAENIESKPADQLDFFEFDVARAALIQHFEFTYELCWKTMKRCIDMNIGLGSKEEITSQRDLFRISGERGFIEDFHIWMDYHRARNKTSHSYDEDIAHEVYGVAKKFKADLDKFVKAVEERL